MITPAGLPAWTRTATPDIYGAVPGLHDLGGVGAVNARTDITAAEYARMAADAASAVRVAPLVWIAIQSFAPPVGDAYANVIQCAPQWDVPSGAYVGTAPPNASYPTVEYNASELTLTWPDLVTTIGGLEYLRVADAFGVYGTCRITSVVPSTGGLVLTIPLPRIVDGTEVVISNVVDDGVYTYLVIR